MKDEIDEFPFMLAEHLHMTVEQVQAMSNIEYLQWQALLTKRAAMANMR